MILDIIHRFRHWIRLNNLDNKQPPHMPILLVIWPDDETFSAASSTMLRDEDLRYQVRLNQPKPPLDWIQDVPVEHWHIDGVPVAFTTLDGRRLVPIRPLNKVKTERRPRPSTGNWMGD